ncbi:MAG: hypothetical protein IPH86_01215 [bacterium]|nr:hypothetical protein [bacterium]
MKVAINGFGSRGRAVFRALQGRPGLELVAVNAALDAESMAYLARRDSVRGPFPGACELVDGCLVTARGSALLTTATDPGDLPWRRLGVETVVEAGDCLDGCGDPESAPGGRGPQGRRGGGGARRRRGDDLRRRERRRAATGARRHGHRVRRRQLPGASRLRPGQRLRPGTWIDDPHRTRPG